MDDITEDVVKPQISYVNDALNESDEAIRKERKLCFIQQKHNGTGLTTNETSSEETNENQKAYDRDNNEKKYTGLRTNDSTCIHGERQKTEYRTEESLCYKIKHDRMYRDEMLYVVLLWWCFIVFGWTIAQFGPSFSEIRLITNTNLQEASAFVTSGAIGYLVGAFIGGALYRAIHVDLILFLSGCGLGAFTEAIPFCRIYEVMILVMFCKSVSAGILDTVANAELLSLRLDNTKSYMQALHFFFAFGGILSPLATAPFLSYTDAYDIDSHGQQNMSTNQDNLTLNFPPLMTANKSDFANGQQNIYTDSDSLTLTFAPKFVYPANGVDSNNSLKNISAGVENSNWTGNSSLLNTNSNIITSKTEYDPQNQVLYIPYTMTAVLNIVTAFLFLFQYFRRKNKRNKTNLTQSSDRQHKTRDENKRRQRLMDTILLIMTLVVMALNCIVEDSIANFLSTFLEKQLNWEREIAAYATSLFWGTFCAGRFFGIFLVRWLNLSHVLMAGSSLIILCFAGLYFSSIFIFDIGIWLCVAITGGAISLIFPTIFSWIEEKLFPVTGSISSMLLISASFGTMVTPLALGYLMDNFTPLYFCYLPFGSNVAFLFVFIILFLLAKKKRQIKYVVL